LLGPDGESEKISPTIDISTGITALDMPLSIASNSAATAASIQATPAAAKAAEQWPALTKYSGIGAKPGPAPEFHELCT